MKFKRLLTTLLLIGSLAFGGYIKPPEAVKNIYHIDSNLTPVYNLSTGKISMGVLSTAYQLTNLTVGDVAKLTTTLADSLYLRLDGTNEMAAPLILSTGGSASAPDLTFSGDTNTGLFQIVANSMGITINGSHKWTIPLEGNIVVFGKAGPAILWEDSSLTNPTLIPDDTYLMSGIGGASGNPAIIANSINIMAFSESSGRAITTSHGLLTQHTSESVNDEAEIVWPTGVSGWGVVMAGDNEEWTQFRFSADGTVNLINNTANVVNTDTDTNLCIYDAGSGIAIKNRLGSAKIIAYEIHYK
jgi:hypothetical protein